MNFKLKTLVAALALVAVSTSANAAIDAASGNSEFAFSAWDASTGIGYTYDLNWATNFQDLVGLDQAQTAVGDTAMRTLATTLPGGVLFDSVLTGLPFGAATSSVQWNLTSIDINGRTRMITTQGDSYDATKAIRNLDVTGAATAFNLYSSASNGYIVTPGEDTYAVTNDTNGAAYAGTPGDSYLSLFDTTSTLGGTSFLTLLAQSSRSASLSGKDAFQQNLMSGVNNVVARTYLANNEWHLQVAAVPEPETNAMMLAGLGLMGFIARRRRNNLSK